jgi:hypothetical protein
MFNLRSGQYVGMPRFAFRVEEALASLDGFEGVALAGPVLEGGFNFGVGDSILVPTAAGELAVLCSGVVLANWGASRRDWLTITVTGVDYEAIARGSVAHAERAE